MSQNLFTKWPELLQNVLRGNLHAINFCTLVFSISQVWDDLHDGDKPVTQAQLNGAFWNALFALPANEFYRKYEPQLQPLMQAAVVDWMAANNMEKSTELQHKAVAYALRDSCTRIVLHCALLVGGYEWMQQQMPIVLRALYDEPLDSFIASTKQPSEAQ